MKRLFDILLALAGISASMPLWAIISFIVLVDGRGPVFYSQDRVGRSGRIFKGIKFRSMIHEAEKESGPIQAHSDDARITAIGKVLRSTAMDELPQLINILKGDMSFVGPRALRPEEKEAGSVVVRSIFEVPGFERRSRVRPGLTGIAQVFAPRDISREKKFKYDIWYIENGGFLLDMYLMVLSVMITLTGKWEAGGERFVSLGRALRKRVEGEIRGV